MEKDRIVIVGAGEAGARAALELREIGFEGSITMIGKERLPPYERPPLSKAALLAADMPAPATIANNEKLSDHRITLVSDSEAIAIDRREKRVRVADGRSFGYERLLLATGASPRRLTLEGSDTSGLLYLRTYSDALALRERLVAGRHIVVIGGGFIGLEVAASARERGCDVTLLEVGPRILMRGVPIPIAEEVEKRHREAGVSFKLGTGIIAIRLDEGGKYAIAMADGSELVCDEIVAGIGAVPDTALASECGLALDNGIAVNERLQTSDPAIYAAGDCCSFPHALYGGKRIRLEAWRNAVDQAAVAAWNLAGGSKEYAAVPWFWSDQYDRTLQVAGLTDYGAETIERSSGEGGNWRRTAR